MRKHIVRALAALGVVFSMTALASAQTGSGLPGNGWYTTAVIQNVGQGAAATTLDVYPQSSGTKSSVSTSISQNASAVFFPGSGGAGGNLDVAPALVGSFTGSMVISSNQPVVAIGQITNFPVSAFNVGTPNGYAAEQFRGSQAASSTLTYPNVKSNYGNKTTVFSVQAAGADVTYTATIFDAAGGTHTRTGSIPANRSITLQPADFTPAMATTNCGSANTSPCFGSIKVVATGGNIVGAVVEFVTGQSPAQVAQATAMFADTDAGTTVYCPIFKNDFGGNHRTTGLAVANTGGSTMNVSVSFAVSAGANAGSSYNTTATIAPNKSVVFSPFAPANIGGMPAGNLASATITSTNGQPAVAIVSESNPGGNPFKATIYSCFSAASATSKAAVPVFKRSYGNNTTGVAVQNANTSGNVTVNATFVCHPSGSTTNTTYGPIASKVLAPGESDVFLDPAGIPAGNLCSATLDAGGTNKIIAVVNESSDGFPAATTYRLNTKNYEAFNL